LYGRGYDYGKTFDARIRAVKLEDVAAAARKYLGKHVLVTASPLVAKPQAVKPQAADRKSLNPEP